MLINVKSRRRYRLYMCEQDFSTCPRLFANRSNRNGAAGKTYLVVAVSDREVTGDADNFVEERLVRFFVRPRRFAGRGRSTRPNQMGRDVSELQRDSFRAQNFLKQTKQPKLNRHPSLAVIALEFFEVCLHEAAFVGNNLHVK